jgi:large repetitive protein
MKRVARKPMMKLIKYSLCLLLFLNITAVYSQNLAQHNWYFGNTKDGIRFNRGNNKAQAVADQAIPFGTGGSAVATDPANANLLFYSDGVRVFDACHNQMINGSGLLGNSSGNQPVVISQIPGQSNKYYIITNNANFITGGSIAVTVVDMTLFGNAVFPAPALGDIEVAKKNIAIPGLTNQSEGMIIIPHSNSIDYWLITHQNNSANYSATLLNAASYTTGIFVTTTTSGVGSTPIPVTVSNFSYNPKLKKLAISVQNPGDDALIADFNPTTGAITFDRYILNSGIVTAMSESIYDIQWDIKGGQYLYISRIGEPGISADVLQYDYKNPSISFASVLPVSVSSTISKSYGLQLAPDSAIYHLYQSTSGNFLVEKFSKTDTIASEVIKTQPFGTTNFIGTQFPSFLPQTNVNLTVSFTTAGVCQNNPVNFFPNVTPNADSLKWDFGDGKNSKAWSPIHSFAQAQTFNVSLTAFYQGQKKSVTQSVVINPFTLKLQLVQDTTACRDEFPPPRGTATPATQFKVKVKVTQGTATSFSWSNGDLGDTLTPDSAGYYYVVATDATGCSTYAGVNVKEYKLNDQRSNIWYFGNKAGIDFNQNPPVALNTSAMNAPAGCAIVCDRNGKTIFYTDGDKVYDKTNTQIDIGIGGDPNSAQSSLIVPVPGDETLYYIFTTQAIPGSGLNELRYSIFDLKKNSGNGQVTQKNILLFSKSTERITANRNWIIAHEYGNSTFRTYPITRQGIGEAVYSDIGSVHSFKSAANGQGYMKLGPRGNLAVALSTPGTSNVIELFQLDNVTGIISNYRKVDMSQPNGEVYGIEFSPGGRKLFATIKGSPSPPSIYEYYLDSLDVKPPVLVGTPVQRTAELGALQIAPDGRTIYFAINGSSTLGSLIADENKIPTPSAPPNFSATPPLLGGTNSRLGLPNFIQQVGNGFGGPGFTFAGTCLGDTTKFVGTPTDAIDKFLWTFGDGASSTDSSPKHLYASAGPYTVSMKLTNRCGLDTTIVQQVKINPPAPKPTVAPASVFCNGSITLNANTGNLPGLTHLWTNGATTPTVIIAQPAVISVTNTDANGCKSTAKAVVVDNRPILDLGPDLTVCQNNATTTLNANNPGATYVWTLNGATNANTSQTQAIDTTLPGTFTYGVTVTDPITTCTIKDEKVYLINVSPSFAIAGTNPTGCNISDGTVSITLNSTVPAGGPYSYFISGNNSFNQQGFDQIAPSVIGPIPGASAGTVSGIVTDQISGCTISSSVSLSDAAFTANATTTNCDPSLVTVAIASGSPSAPVLYTFTPIGVTSVAGVNFFGPQTINQAKLPPGNYSIQVRENNGTGCTYSFNQLVNPIVPTLTITPNLCANPAKLDALVAGGITYTWTLPNGNTFIGPSLTVPTNGTGTYKVDADLGGGCTLSQSTSIIYNGVLAPAFTQSDGCSSQVVLSATPIGSFTYRWYKNGSATIQALGQQITLGPTEDGQTYQVEVVDAINGCNVRSTSNLVQVSGPVDASVTATQACQDENPFTLTATTTATAVTYKWFLNTVELTGKINATLTETREGKYKVTISKATTCSASASIEIIKVPLPQGLLDDRAVICADPQNLNESTNKKELKPGVHATYNWFYQKDISSSKTSLNSTDPTFIAREPGIFLVDITNPQGCKNTDQTEIINECIPKIVGPNAFRPANAVNSLNKDFFVYSFFIANDDFEVSIFNRWGEIVYQSKDKDFKWNGGYGGNAGQPLPGGTYAYVIRYKSSFRPQDGIKEQRGGIVLLR